MWWRTERLLILTAAVCLCLTACGYQFSANAPIVLPQGVTDLHLNRVIDPTTEPWLEPRLRSVLRDEFTQRGQIQWVDESLAQALMQVEILRFSDSGKIKGAQEQTLKSEIKLKLEAKIFQRADRTLLWASPPINVRQSYDTGDESERLDAGFRAVDLAVEQLADALGQKF